MQLGPMGWNKPTFSNKGSAWSTWGETWKCGACKFDNWGSKNAGCNICKCNPGLLKKWGVGGKQAAPEPSYRTASAVAARAEAKAAAAASKPEPEAPCSKAPTEATTVDHKQLIVDLTAELEHLAGVSGDGARQLEVDKKAELERSKAARREENPLATLAVVEKRITERQEKIDKKAEAIAEAEKKLANMLAQVDSLKGELDTHKSKLAELKDERAKLTRLAAGTSTAKEQPTGTAMAKLAKITEALLEGVKDNAELAQAASCWLEHLRREAATAAEKAEKPGDTTGQAAGEDAVMDGLDFDDEPLPEGKFYSAADLDADLQAVDGEADPEKLRAMVKRLAAPARAATRHAKRAKQNS